MLFRFNAFNKSYPDEWKWIVRLFTILKSPLCQCHASSFYGAGNGHVFYGLPLTEGYEGTLYNKRSLMPGLLSAKRIGFIGYSTAIAQPPFHNRLLVIRFIHHQDTED